MGIGNLRRIKQLYDRITAARQAPETLQTPGTWYQLFQAAWRVDEVRLMLTWLQGKKTYIVMALAGLTLFLNWIGVMDDLTRDALLKWFAVLGGATVAAKINRQAKS